jgi:adenosylcobinamide-phosphate synthase
MSFVALLIALALEQWRPLVDRHTVFAPVAAYTGIIERNFDAGEMHHGAIAWVLAVVPIVVASWVLYAAANAIHPLLGVVVNVAALYVTMGFREHSHYFTDIHAALKEGDLDTARRLLGEWRGHSCDMLSAEEVARLTIEGALTVSHRHVFGAMFWFVVLPGPTGAVLYRMALFLGHRWGGTGRAGQSGPTLEPALAAAADGVTTMERPIDEIQAGDFGAFARQAFYVIDWLPVRVTAASFAIVGDFEDAVYCWRTQAMRWPDRLLGIVLAAGAGALGVRLGAPITRSGVVEARPELGLDDEADTPFLDSTIGLIWRALSLWLLVLLVLSFARALG